MPKIALDLSIPGVALRGGAAVAVTSPRGQTLFVYEGDSISRGGGTSITKHYNKFDHSTRFPGRMIVTEKGVDGSTLDTVEGRAAAVDALLANVPWRTAAILTCNVGTNDSGSGSYSGNSSAFLTAYANYCDARRAAGWKVVIYSVTPSGLRATPDAWRTTLNATTRTWVGTHCDAYADLDTEATMGLWATTQNATYYPDTVHISQAGYDLLYALTKPAVLGQTVARSQPSSYGAWNPSDKNAGVTLSGSNYIAGSTGGWINARGVGWRDAGKYFLEVRMTGNIDQMVGLARMDHSLAQYFAQSNGRAIGVWGNGGALFKSTHFTTVNAFTTGGSSLSVGDYLQFAVDFDNGKIWVGLNGTYPGSGNPATGANESYTFDANMALCPMCSLNSASATATLPTSSASLQTPVPSGFTAW